MATETTKLLNGCVINMPNNKEGLFSCNLMKGLSLEELMPFENDPWWQKMRRTFLLSFWLVLIAMFAGACVISVLQHGSCPAKSGLNHQEQIDQAIAALAANNSTIGDAISRTEGSRFLAL